MGKHTLFMLNPWTEANGQGPYYCPDCGVVEGFLAYSPEIRQKIEIISVNFLRPRNEIVSQLGLENQDCPVLVLDDEATTPEGARQSMSTGKKFINDAIEICNFLGENYNGVKPHP
ncbi:MAG: DUF3088 domain-containing protein [Desulfobulbaceae bacterium]|nr:DUF3088 domain-containing protein [Desulfobulbaceae bacterium]